MCHPKGNTVFFAPFWSGIGYGFWETKGVYERIYRLIPNDKKEKYANSKCILRNLFSWRSNLTNDDIIS